MVLKLVERRPMANAAEQFVQRVPERTWCVVAAQSAKRRVQLAESGMGQTRFGRIAQFEVMQVAQSDVELAQLWREFRLTDLPSREMQPVALHNLVAIDEDTAL